MQKSGATSEHFFTNTSIARWTASAVWSSALKLDPDHKLGWANLAYMVGRLGHHHHAIAFADRALALDEHLVEAYLHKGAAARALGKNEVLREVCSALSAIPPEKFRRAR